MKRESSGPILSTVFVDYDNIYLSLKRKNEDAAKRFAKDSGVWLQGLLSGELITPTSNMTPDTERRLVMNRCYGNPVPRRNAHDNSTDMNSFPFIRHHFLRSGFEVIDCPPLTAQLKNSADIRMVMDIRDILNHDTFFDEFIILSGDADFTPVLHRLRAHARRTIVFANDHTAQPYTALSDGEIRESSLISLLLSNTAVTAAPAARELAAPTAAPRINLDQARQAIINEVVAFVRNAPLAVPLETLADRAVRIVGRDSTIDTNWVGFGSFRDLLLADLPDDLHLSDTPPYTVFDANRHISSSGLIASPTVSVDDHRHTARHANVDMRGGASELSATRAAPKQAAAPVPPPSMSPIAAAPRTRVSAERPAHAASTQQNANANGYAPTSRAGYNEPGTRRVTAPQQAPQHANQQAPRKAEQATQVQQSIARIHEACQAPALAPAEYRVLFDIMAQEISANGLQGSQTLVNLTQRAREFGLDLKRDDLRFILEVVSESDPWFEQGASANLFASRFRNFVVARCRSHGLSLSAEELDLIEAWFSAQAPQPQRSANYGPASAPQTAPRQTAAAGTSQRAAQQGQPHSSRNENDRWWSLEEGRQHISDNRAETAAQAAAQAAADDSGYDEEFPLIVRSRLRG